MKTIVVLGAGLAGVPLIRQIMRTTVLNSKDYKMIVVAPTTHFFWPIAMPRVVVPGQMPEAKVLYPLEPTFKEYPAEKFEFVLGSAKELDPKGNVITIALNDGSGRTIEYSTLVIATGSSAKDGLPWKLVGTADQTTQRIHELQKKIEGAKTIVIAGGGITGSETAGELGHLYGKQGKKEVFFVYNDDLPLSPAVLESVRKQVKIELERMNVKLIPNSTISKVSTEGDDTILELANANGTTKTLAAQAYLPTTGVTPNTAFVPSQLLDSKGYIKQTNVLRADGYENIFVVGDAGNLEDNKAWKADAQALHLIKALPVYLAGGQLTEYKPDTKPMCAITLGPNKGTGQMGNFKLFGFLIKFAKGRYLGTDKAPGISTGKVTLTSTLEK